MKFEIMSVSEGITDKWFFEIRVAKKYKTHSAAKRVIKLLENGK